MQNRFNRSEFYKRELVDGREEFDLISNSINDFNFSRETTLYTVIEADIKRPDLIAIKAYGDKNKMNCWWIILQYNNIENIWNDLYEGQILNIPHPLDLEDLLVSKSNKG